MIKPIELRLGNRIHKHFEDGLGEEIEVSVRDIFDAQRSIVEKSFKFSFNGIPLTEEWLLKFGLTIHRKQLALNVGGELFDFIVIGKEPNAYCLWYCEGKGFTLDGVVKRETRFVSKVHELQNFVFALTGKELELTPSTV